MGKRAKDYHAIPVLLVLLLSSMVNLRQLVLRVP
jgi:hypothetical protein